MAAVNATNNIDALIQDVNTAILNYCANSLNSDLVLNLEDQLTLLTRELSTIENSRRLRLNASNVEQLLLQTYELLCNSTTPVTIRSKLLLYLYNLTQYNVKIRRYLSGELQIAGTIYQNLKIALQQQLGPQNLIDNLRLLQVLTYEKNLVLAEWTSDLLTFLLAEITRSNGQEWLPYCVAILCNLVCRSKAVCSKIMKDEKNYRTLCKRLVEFLQNPSRTIVICSLTMVGYLHEQTRDIVFSHPHLSETFLCIFNIMKSRENIMTRHVAIDLCRRLIISDSSNISFSPTLANTAKDLTSYSFFPQCIRDLSSHLVLLDSRTEECIKIYEFFLSICQLHQLRPAVCGAILSAKPIENRLTTPVLGMLRTATWSFDESVDPEVPILACELLTYVLKEAVDSSQPIQQFVPLESLVDLIRSNVKTTIETKSEIVSYQCRRITCGLRLADAISGDEEARKELLEATTAQLCAHVNESQLISNPVSLYLSKPPARRFSTDLPEWSTYGVTIPLELLKLLASLKDYNKAHKELYWKSLKDERLIPFLAYAISYGNGSTVLDALTLFTHCTQIQDYRIKLLSDLIASCGKTKTSKEKKGSAENGTNVRKSISLDTYADARAREEIGELTERLLQEKEEKETLEKEKEDIKQTCSELTERLRLEKVEKEMIEKQKEDIKHSCAELTERLRKEKKEKEVLEKEMAGTKQSLSEVTERLRQEKVEKEMVKKDLAEIRQTLAKLLGR